ncbi:hypothetical protein ACA609_10160 [Lactiplantibacillus plantarum]|uniref:hypothetical protein n=1 Tax=Lactiplantibacillus plantarum TaxID=1590 RepID=UPI003C2056C9
MNWSNLLFGFGALVLGTLQLYYSWHLWRYFKRYASAQTDSFALGGIASAVIISIILYLVAVGILTNSL